LNDHNSKQPSLSEGTVIWADFPRQSLPDRTNSGHEMEGKHPAVVVSCPEKVGKHFDSLIVAPLTKLTEKKLKDWVLPHSPLYLLLPSGAANLEQDSIVMIDQIRFLDARRVLGIQGKLTPVQFKFIKNSVRLIL